MYYKIIDNNKLYICIDIKFDANRNLLQLITRHGMYRVYDCSPEQYENIYTQILIKSYGDISHLKLNEQLTMASHNIIIERN